MDSISQDTKKRFAAKIDEIMTAKGLRAEDLYVRCHAIKAASVWRWRNAERFPRPRTLVDLAQALDVPLQDLLVAGIPLQFRAEVESISKTGT